MDKSHLTYTVVLLYELLVDLVVIHIHYDSMPCQPLIDLLRCNSHSLTHFDIALVIACCKEVVSHIDL